MKNKFLKDRTIYEIELMLTMAKGRMASYKFELLKMPELSESKKYYNTTSNMIGEESWIRTLSQHLSWRRRKRKINAPVSKHS